MQAQQESSNAIRRFVISAVVLAAISVGINRHQYVHCTSGVASADDRRRKPALAAQGDAAACRRHHGSTLWDGLRRGFLPGACH